MYLRNPRGDGCGQEHGQLPGHRSRRGIGSGDLRQTGGHAAGVESHRVQDALRKDAVDLTMGGRAQENISTDRRV